MSPLQNKILQYIREYIHEHSYSPTLEEIARGIGISPRSVSLISRSVRALVDVGQLTFYKKGYRNIQLVDQTLCSSSCSLPLLGRIAAGVPIEAIPQAQLVDFGALLQNDKYFLLEVKGDSMIDEGIFDGDWIICMSAEQAREGEIIIALIDNMNTTLKTVSYKMNGYITLIPANPNLKPKSYLPERIQIQAVYVGLFRLKK